MTRNGHASQGPWASSAVQHPEFCASVKTGKKRSADPNFETARARTHDYENSWSRVSCTSTRVHAHTRELSPQ